MNLILNLAIDKIDHIQLETTTDLVKCQRLNINIGKKNSSDGYT